MQRDAFRPARFYQKREQGSEQGKGDEVHIAVSVLLTFHVRYYIQMQFAQVLISLLSF